MSVLWQPLLQFPVSWTDHTRRKNKIFHSLRLEITENIMPNKVISLALLLRCQRTESTGPSKSSSWFKKVLPYKLLLLTLVPFQEYFPQVSFLSPISFVWVYLSMCVCMHGKAWRPEVSAVPWVLSTLFFGLQLTMQVRLADKDPEICLSPLPSRKTQSVWYTPEHFSLHLFVHMRMQVCTCRTQYGEQTTSSGRQFSPTAMRVPGIKTVRLVASTFTCWADRSPVFKVGSEDWV